MDPRSGDTVRLAADLVATMRVSAGCVGLAALPGRCGVREVFCLDVSAHPKTRAHHGELVLCNAELLEASRNERGREGCLASPTSPAT